MHILVLQHERVEHPGVFRRFLKEDGHTWDAIELDEGESLPDIDGYDALWVMGGPQNVWQEDEYPWLKEEKAFIRDAVEGKGVPFLGICLGHQLLAEALGGKAEKARTPEIGVRDVHLTETGADGVFFDGLPESFKCFQWHGAEVTELPIGAQVLATSPACPVQAMKWGTRAYSVQFHMEIEEDTVEIWNSVPEVTGTLEHVIGKIGFDEVNRDCAAHMKGFHERAERIYINWLQATARA